MTLEKWVSAHYVHEKDTSGTIHKIGFPTYSGCFARFVESVDGLFDHGHNPDAVQTQVVTIPANGHIEALVNMIVRT